MDIEQILNAISDKLSLWVKEVILLIPNVAIAMLIFISSLFIANLISKYFKKVLKRYLDNNELINFFATLTKVLVLFTGFLLSVYALNLDKLVISLLAGAGIIGVALGFAFQDLVANLISGIALVLKKEYPFKVGDHIETNGYVGFVQEINLRSTIIKTFQGQYIMIPNRQIFENPLINFNFQEQRRIDVEVGISYGEDLQRIEDIVKECLKDLKHKSKDTEVEFFYKEYGDSSINFSVRVWINYYCGDEYFETKSQIIKNIKSAFNANSITIPFPIRTLDFGIKGGKELSPEMVSKLI